MTNRYNELFYLHYNKNVLELFACYRDCFDPNSYLTYNKEALYETTVKSWNKILELYDTITITAGQMIDVERTNSGRTWMDSDKTQAADFETLNGRLRLWHGLGRDDEKVIKLAFNNWLTKDKERRRSYKTQTTTSVS